MKPVTRLLDSIPHRGLRRVATLALMLAFSLILGFALEQTMNKDALAGMKKAQDQWIADVSQLTPMGLVDGYLGDLGAAAAGRWLYEPPPKPKIKNEIKLVQPAPTAAEIACEEARARRGSVPSCNALYPGSKAACVAGTSTDPTCAAYTECLASEVSMLADPFECYGLARSRLLQLPPVTESPLLATASAPSPPTGQLHPILIPFAAIVHGVTRIIDGGLWTILLAGFQLGVGFVAFRVITSAFNKSGKAGLGDQWTNALLGPVCVIVLGSVVALILQGFMLGALYLFSWITGLAAAAAGATGVAGGVWWSVQKLTEKGIEDAVTKRV
jgi:hypothetical protein